jgi:hypothetical protein
MEPQLNCSENKEKTPKAASIRTQRFVSQTKSRRWSKRTARGGTGEM